MVLHLFYRGSFCSGSTMGLRLFYNGSTVVLQWFYGGSTVVLHRFFSGSTVFLQCDVEIMPTCTVISLAINNNPSQAVVLYLVAVILLKSPLTHD